MDENKYLILDTRVGYKDLTGDVASVNPRGDRIKIIFNNLFRVAVPFDTATD